MQQKGVTEDGEDTAKNGGTWSKLTAVLGPMFLPVIEEIEGKQGNQFKFYYTSTFLVDFISILQTTQQRLRELKTFDHGTPS